MWPVWKELAAVNRKSLLDRIRVRKQGVPRLCSKHAVGIAVGYMALIDEEKCQMCNFRLTSVPPPPPKNIA